MKKQDKLEAFVGCACVFGTLGIAIYKAIKNGRAQRKALNEQFEKDMKEIDERSVKREQGFNEFMENLEKEKKAEDERHTAAMKKHEEEMKRLERERKEAEEKHQINMDKLHQYDLRSKERFENAETKEERLAALHEDFEDLHAVGNEICESIFGHKLGETRIVFKGKLAEMMEEKMKED